MATWVVYDLFKKTQLGLSGQTALNLATDTAIKIMLATAAYTPNVATDQFATTPIGSEVTADGTSYIARGLGVTLTVTGPSSDVITVSTSTTITWAQAAGGFTNARWAILYKDSGTNSSSPLIAYADLVSEKSIRGGSLTLQIDAAGIFTLT